MQGDPDGHLGHTVSSVDPSGRGRVFVDLDSALEWAETALLDRYCGAGRIPEAIDLADHPLLENLDPDQFERFAAELDVVEVPGGRTFVRRGDNAIGIVLILSGRISTMVTGPDGSPHRITTLAPGMTFGEMPP